MSKISIPLFVNVKQYQERSTFHQMFLVLVYKYHFLYLQLIMILKWALIALILDTVWKSAILRAPYLGLPTFRCFSFKPLINGIFAKHMCVGIGHQVVHSVFNRFHWKLWKSAILRAPYLGLRTFQEFSVYTTDSYKPWQTYVWPDSSPSCPINPQYLKPFSIKKV